MDPLTAGLGGVSALEGLIGLFQKHDDPLKRLQQIMDMIYNRIPSDTNRLYGQFKGSPMYTSAINNVVGGAQQSSNLLRRNLAATGMLGSGVGTIQNSLSPSVMGGQITGLNADLYGKALQTVMGLIPHLLSTGASGGLARPSNLSNIMRLASGISNTNWSWLLPNKGVPPIPITKMTDFSGGGVLP